MQQFPISNLGKKADGVSVYNNKPLFIGFTAPGDVVTAKITRELPNEYYGALQKIIIESKDRQTPPCKHFGYCGGCKLQHINAIAYTNFKQGILQDILARLGSEDSLKPMIKIGEYSRRRAEFKVMLNKSSVKIGFFAPGSNDVIEISECLIVEKSIFDLIAPLKDCITQLKKPGNIKSVMLTCLTNGIDAVITCKDLLSATDKNIFNNFATHNKLLRISQTVAVSDGITPEYIRIYDSGNALINLGGINIEPPVGAFLQATLAGQEAITDIILDNVGNARNIADLYAGCGTYSLPLLRKNCTISAYEGSSDMVMALAGTANRNQLTRLSVQTRDLFKKPLLVNDLNNFDLVIINPPRAGALPQIKELAKSIVPKIIMVSCNPSTAERDVQELLKSGYRIIQATAIDQFYWSGHLELVVVLSK